MQLKLPDGAEAIVKITKLRDYCLNPSHPRGRHKARVFRATLGLRQTVDEFLRGTLMRAAREAEAEPAGTDEFGERFTIDFEITRGNRGTTVRSAWIILREETTPRLITCSVP